MKSEKLSIRLGVAADNDIVLKEKIAAPYHAIIQIDQQGSIVIQDLKTEYGTLLNNIKVENAFINEGDVVQIGFYRISFDEIVALFIKHKNKEKKHDSAIQQANEVEAKSSSSHPKNEFISIEEIAPQEENLFAKNIEFEEVNSIEQNSPEHLYTNDADQDNQAQRIANSKKDNISNELSFSENKPIKNPDNKNIKLNYKTSTFESENDDAVKERRNKTEIPNSTKAKWFALPIVIILGFGSGALIGAKHFKADIASIEKYGAVNLPSGFKVAREVSVFSNCNSHIFLDAELKYKLMNQKENLSGSKFNLDMLCELFDKHATNFTDLLSALINKQAWIAIPLQEERQASLWICIGRDQKFSVSHFINKRYNLNATLSIDSPLKIKKASDSSHWIYIDEGARFPGDELSENLMFSQMYHLHIDSCKSGL
jgi:pSer/pThr/pTyr-binding forkhead associated (FHA) protein